MSMLNQMHDHETSTTRAWVVMRPGAAGKTLRLQVRGVAAVLKVWTILTTFIEPQRAASIPRRPPRAQGLVAHAGSGK
jgi:hypothetical protein